MMDRKTPFLKMLFGISFILILLSSLGGCYYDQESELYPYGLACDSLAISFVADVYPIISAKCLGCHDAGSNSGSVTMETYSQIKAQANSGMLGCTINHEAGCSAMPQNAGQLPTCDLQAINVWINEGALNN